MNFRFFAIAASALFLLLTTFAAGATPARVSYQGRLTNAVGLALNGNYSLIFNIYNLAAGGSLYPIHVGTSTANGNGARLSAAGVWTDASSRSFKENFVEIGGAELLDKISQLTTPHYNYKGTAEMHIGPMAEDFAALFNVGSIDENTGQIDPMYLSAKDVAGVALAGVKELIERNRNLESRITQLETLLQLTIEKR